MARNGGVGYCKGLNIFMALDLHWNTAYLSGLIGFSMPLAKSDLFDHSPPKHWDEFVELPKSKMPVCYCTLNASAHS